MDLSPLAAAIIKRSEPGVVSAISIQPGAVLERTFGMTVLHLSSSWAAGLHILLDRGAGEVIDDLCHDARSDGEMVSALDLAIRYRSLEAVHILLDAGCSWQRFRGLDRDQQYPHISVAPAIVESIARVLAHRRRKLLDLGRSCLTKAQLSRRGCADISVPDVEAAGLTQLLINGGVSVSATLAVSDIFHGVYQSSELSMDEFPVFHEAGFQDLRRFNCLGLSPVMMGNLWELVY